MPRGNRGAPLICRSPPRWAIGSGTLFPSRQIHLPGPRAKFDDSYAQVRDLIASGMSDRQAVIAVTGSDKSGRWTTYLKKRPHLAAEVAAVRHAKGKPSLDRIAENFDSMMVLIAEGRDAVEAGRELGINGYRLTAYLLEHEEQRPAYVAAMHKRAKVLGLRSTTSSVMKRRKPFTDAEFDSALALIARSNAPDLATALRRADLPTNGSLQRRARKDPQFRARLDRAYSAHAASTNYLRYIKDPAEPRLLLASLLRDPTFAAAFKKFKKLDERYDLAQEYVLAVLEGQDVKQPETIKGIRRRALLDNFRFTSLDAPAHDDSERETFGDTLAAPCIIQHY